MYESDDELTALQVLLDASYARANEHLRFIWGEDSRLDARGLGEELVGVQVLGTVTPRGEPRVAPVDGLFFRGSLWFGRDAGGFADYAREVYDFDWDAVHPDAPYARIEAHTLLAFKRPEASP
jgi:hypothetical protein